MGFTEVNIVTSDPDLRDIFAAELGEVGFDTFQETDEGLCAYTTDDLFDQDVLNEITSRYEGVFEFSIKIKSIKKENWNKKWEENYDPIEIDDRCIVRASFHQIKKKYLIEIVVTPKMSFGTGHHATTWQMLKLQLDVDFRGKRVLDVGSGTGVLAIMAAKLGATHIEATDIDDWCVENSSENFELNDLKGVETQIGEINTLRFNERFDIILANINKNVLLKEIGSYSELLVPEGNLFLSGFYEEDIADIISEAERHGLSELKTITKNDWAAMLFSQNQC